MLGVLASGRDPSAGQASDALEALQDMANTMFPQLGGPWIDQDVTEDVTAEENDRIRVNSYQDVSIYLPVTLAGRERVVDQCGCITVQQTCSNERAPRDGGKVWIADIYGSFAPRLYIYRGDAAEWVLASALTLDGPSPWGLQYKEGVAAILATRLAPEFGQEIAPIVVRMATEGRLALAQRFDAQRRPATAEYF